MKKDINILVVYGGISSEREVSLRSGKSVYEALIRKGYINVKLFDLTRESIGKLLNEKIDIAFLALHGKGGEDGCIQGMLELAGIPYTGPGVCCSAVCMNKIVTKQVLTASNLPTAKFAVFCKNDSNDLNIIARNIIKNIGIPLVLKSPCQGSSIGVVIVKEENQIHTAIKEVFKYGNQLLAEQFLSGIELTLPIMGNKELEMLPIVEITSEREFYDYTAKYTSGLFHHIIPARIDKQTEHNVIDIGKKAYQALNCCGLARIDFIVDKEKGPMVIEVNTLPGMTDLSLFPDAARKAGISYEDLIEKILEFGLTASRDLY